MLEEKKLIDIFTKAINQNFEANSETISEVAKRCFDVIKKGGVIQLFGARTGEEFVNELFFRAGGLSPFHGIKLVDLLTRGLITQSDIDSGEVYNDLSILKKFESIYKLDNRDAYILVSELGNEPLLVEMALQAKQKKQLVIAVINRDSYSQAKVVHSSGKKLCDLADLEIITDLPKQDIITKISGYPVGQLFGTVINVLAQCLCADLYTQYINNDLEAPVLLSANVRGADAHNKALTDVFCGRVR